MIDVKKKFYFNFITKSVLNYKLFIMYYLFEILEIIISKLNVVVGRELSVFKPFANQVANLSASLRQLGQVIVRSWIHVGAMSSTCKKITSIITKFTAKENL